MKKHKNLINKFLSVLTGNGFVVLSQSIIFLVAARCLGANQFGEYSATLALVTLIQPMVGLGQQNVLLLKSSIDQITLPVHLGNAVVVVFISGTLFILCLVSGAIWVGFTQQQITMLLLLSLAEFMFVKLLEVHAHALLANEAVKVATVLMSIPSIFRMIAVLLWSVSESTTLLSLVTYYLGSSFFSFMVCYLLFIRNKFSYTPSFEAFKLSVLEGLGFSLGFASKATYTDVDKPILAAYTPPDAVGAYVSASRIVALAHIPVRALVLSSQAKFYRAGSIDSKDTIERSKKYLYLIGIYGLICAILIYLGAPLVVELLGSSYKDSIAMIQFLCVIPFLFSIQTFAAEILTAIGLQNKRVQVQFMGAVICSFLNLVLVSSFGVIGAIGAAYCTQIFIVFLSMFFVIKNNRL